MLHRPLPLESSSERCAATRDRWSGKKNRPRRASLSAKEGGAARIGSPSRRLPRYYKGEYKAGAKDGYGVFVYRDETRYEGTFANNVKEGQGIMSSPFFPRPRLPTARAERRKAIAGTTPTAPSTSATTTTA